MNTSQRRRVTDLCVSALLLGTLSGCGTRIYPVSGTVTFADGKPLTSGTVSFKPLDEQNKKYSSRGVIREDGSYQIGTFADADGAHEGSYEVAVTPGFPPNPDRPPTGWPPIHERFGRYSDSGLRFTVKAESNTFNITVEK